MGTPVSSDSEWEKVSITENYYSSSSDEEPGNSSNDEWCVIKSKNPKLAIEELNLKEESIDEEDDDGNDFILSAYDSGYSKEDYITDAMLETLIECFPEFEEEENFIPLEYTEQNRFPYLGTKALLHLKHVCSRWDRWISSDFFIHIQSLLHRKISGVFYHDSLSNPAFSSLDQDLFIQDMPPFTYLPERVTVKSSSYGLVVCKGMASGSYYVCNPVISEWVVLPKTENTHGADTAVVIVLKEPHVYNFNKDYYVVCAYEIFDGIYGFETFCSENWKWSVCSDIIAAEKIVPNSGVMVNGKAYWRTTMQKIVAFDPDLNEWKEMVWNNGENVNGDWAIGELGKKLCVVNIEERHVEVWTLEDGEWVDNNIRRDNDITFDRTMPLCTQGEKEVIIWDGKTKTVVALDVETWGERKVEVLMPQHYADFVPYIGTLVHASYTQKHIGSTSPLELKSDSLTKGITSLELQKGKEKKYEPTIDQILSSFP